MRILTTLVIGLSIFGSACSTQPGITTNSNSAQQAETQTYRSVGVIKQVDKEKGTVTIDHEEIPGYMFAMQMTEPVADRSMLDQVNAGDKVDFEILRTGSKVTFTKFAKVSGTAGNGAADIFAANCAECHGKNGEGMPKGIPLTSGHALDHSESDIIQTVANGKRESKGKSMPPFREKLSTEDIAALAKYVRDVLQKDAARPAKPSGHHH